MQDLPHRGRRDPVAELGAAGLEGGVALLDADLVDREHGGGVRASHRLDAHVRAGCWHGYGLTARMIAECTPSPTCWAGVMVMLVNPARASPPRYSAKEGAPAMQPARAPSSSRSAPMA